MNRRAEALNAVRRASDHSASIVHDEIKHGLSTLEFIQSTAPWVGVFGTLQCVYASFGGMRAEGTSVMRVVAGGVSEGLALFAFGLIVSLTAMWLHAYLLREVETFDSDMEKATLQLVDDLASTTFDPRCRLR